MSFAKTMVPVIDFPHKDLRAEVICDYVLNSSYDSIVVFTCGNAGRALKAEGERRGITVVALEPNEWYTHERI